MSDDSTAHNEASPRVTPQRPPPIRIGTVYRRAAHTYRERLPIVAGMAIAVFAPLALLTTAITLWGADYKRDHGGSLGLAVYLATLVGTSAVVLGSAFYAGLLDKVVGEHQHGHHRMTASEILRSLPYRRLIVADLLLTFIVTIGLLVFVLPGLALFTLFALVGPLITIEDQTVVGAFRRSARLIRPVFFTALVAVTLPVLLEHGLMHEIEHVVLHRPPFITAFVLNSLAAATVAAFVGLVEVVLAFSLIHRDAETGLAQDGTRNETPSQGDVVR